MTDQLRFHKAARSQAKLRLALIGLSGSGKTYTSLLLASAIGKKIAVIDTERGSAAKYADEFEFNVLELESFDPRLYVEALHAAHAEGHDVVIIDSLSHAWMGKDGALQQVDNAAKRSKSSNSFAAWREVTPLHNDLVDAILRYPGHVIVTMRAKTEYVLDTNEKGKTVPRKVGLAPVQRDGLEYEFDVVGDMDQENTLVVTKTRCKAMAGAVIARPGKAMADTLLAWLGQGSPESVAAPTPMPWHTLAVAQSWIADFERMSGELDLGTGRMAYVAAKLDRPDLLELKTRGEVFKAITPEDFARLLGLMNAAVEAKKLNGDPPDQGALNDARRRLWHVIAKLEWDGPTTRDWVAADTRDETRMAAEGEALIAGLGVDRLNDMAQRLEERLTVELQAKAAL